MTIEPELKLNDIQGLVIPGFLKPHQALIGLRLPNGSALGPVAGLLLQLLDDRHLATGEQALDDRARKRQGSEQPEAEPLLGLGLSATGLDRLHPLLPLDVPSPAFRNGLSSRAGLLGDPIPQICRSGCPAGSPDAILVVAGNSAATVQATSWALQRRLLAVGDDLVIGPIQFGNVLNGERRGREHFGFADGVSQPGIRGTWRGAPITPRDLRPDDDPDHDLFGHPGQHLVWPGEFVLGEPAASPDPRLPGPVRPVPEWMHNGSFLVYRRLRQDVEAFKDFLRKETARLRPLPGFSTLTEDRLAALLVGRWPSGAPVSRSPNGDNDELGKWSWLNNDFRYDDASRHRSFDPARLPESLREALRDRPPPTAPADPLGLVCPVASHIRKLNLRDQASDMGGASATQSRRILRVGVPYDDTPKDGPPDRGLLFLSIQASIEEQFEFLQARWINSRVRPRGPGGNDMIVGQCAASPDGKRQCVVFGDGGAQAVVETDKDFVTMTGGGYFFVPSLPTLRALLEGTPLPT